MPGETACGSPTIEPSANGFLVTFQHGGQEHQVPWLSSAGDAELACDVLTVMAAVQAGVSLDGLVGLSGSGGQALRLSLAASTLDLLAAASVQRVAQQLATCALEMRRPLADAAGSSLIHVAAQLGHAHTILLLSLVAPDLPHSHNANGQVPLAVAARYGHTNAVAALLLVAPSTAASLSRQGTTPLHAACSAGHVAAARLLLQAHPEAAAVGSLYGWTPLHAAAIGGCAPIAELLLSVAPQTAAALSNGRTPLEIALDSMYGHGLAIKCLAVARCLLPATPASTALRALRSAGPAAQRLFADLAAAAAPLSAEQWALVPTHCPEIGRALPAVLATGDAQARQLVAHLHPADAARLRTFALCLARLQRQMGLELPPALVGRLMALACAA